MSGTGNGGGGGISPAPASASGSCSGDVVSCEVFTSVWMMFVSGSDCVISCGESSGGPRSGSYSSSGTGGRVAICDRDSIAWFHEVELEELEELVEVVVAVGVVTCGGVGVGTYFFMKISS